MINTDELRLQSEHQRTRVEQLMAQIVVSCTVQLSMDNTLISIKTPIDGRECTMCMTVDGLSLQDDSSLLIQLRGAVERQPALAKRSPGVCNQTSDG